MENRNRAKYNGLRVAKVKFEKLHNNNCYTYAINQHINPYTNKPYASYTHCQPGQLGGVNKNGRTSYSNDFSNFLKYIRDDLNSIGYDITPSTYDEYVEDERAWKIAFCYEPRYDYHFYRQNKNGTWSHKQGSGTVRRVDNSGNVIYNPETCDRGAYTKFVGFYIIKPMVKRVDNCKVEVIKYIC